MPYIGTQIEAGNYRKLTNLASGFNGVTTTFTLSVPPGTSQYYVTPTSTYQLLISVGGIIQQPDTDYTVSTNTITFTTAPAAGLSFFGILMGDALNIGTPSDGTVTTAKLASSAVSNDKLADSSVTQSKIGTNVLTPTVSQINGGQLAGTRNRIINGAMAIDQRNAGVSVSSGIGAITYVTDRWSVAASGAAVTAQRQGTAASYWLNITGAASNTITNIRQRIEALNIADLANRTVTLSFICSSSTATSVSAQVSCASALDNFATVTNTQSFVRTITSTGTLYTATFTLPSQATNGVEVLFSLANFTSGTFALSDVQLELGTVATSFERRSFGQELALCQRYYEAGTIGAFASATNTHHLGAPCFYKVTKRAAPTITLTNVANTQFPVTIGTIQAPTLMGFSEVRVANNSGANGAFVSNFTAEIEL